MILRNIIVENYSKILKNITIILKLNPIILKITSIILKITPIFLKMIPITLKCTPIILKDCPRIVILCPVILVEMAAEGPAVVGAQRPSAGGYAPSGHWRTGRIIEGFTGKVDGLLVKE